jgi:hypothetical protein
VCGPRYDASVKIKKLHDDHGLPGTRTPADPRFGTGLGQKKGGPLTATRLDNRPHRPTATHCRRHGGHCGRTRYSPTSSPADPLAGDARAAAGRCGYRTGLHPDHHRCHRRRPEPAGRHGHRRPHHLPDSRAVLWRRRHGAQSSPHSGPATSPKPTLTRRGSPPASAPASQSTPASPWPRQPSRSSSAPTPARPGTDRDNDHLP